LAGGMNVRIANLTFVAKTRIALVWEKIRLHRKAGSQFRAMKPLQKHRPEADVASIAANPCEWKIMKTILVCFAYFTLVLLLTTGCNPQSDSQRDAIVKYQNRVASIGWQLFDVSAEQARDYERKIDLANKYARENGMSALGLVKSVWDDNKEKEWSERRSAVVAELDKIKAEMATNLPSPPKGCEMLSQQLAELVKTTEPWRSFYDGDAGVWEYWEQGITMRYKRVDLEFDKLKDELLRDIAPPVKKPIEGTFKYQSSLLGSTIEERLQFRKTGCVIWQMFSDIPFVFRTYSIDGDRVTVSSSDGGREVFKIDGQDLLSVERYDKTGKKDEEHKMKRYVRS
jgi:hypothetical protein